VLLFAFQGEAIIRQPVIIALLAVPILIQVFFNSGLAYLLNKKLGHRTGWLVPRASLAPPIFLRLRWQLP
jgi:ACR3 family arsenite transporter